MKGTTERINNLRQALVHFNFPFFVSLFDESQKKVHLIEVEQNVS